MFKIGDYMIYGTNGVCEVKDVGDMEALGMTKGRIYYTLEPVYTTGSKFFTPIDNEKVIMRPILKKEEAVKLIDDIKDIESLCITDDKRRENDYKEVMKKCDCRELVKMIKSIYVREQARLEEGKKGAAADDKYFKLAEDYLYGELALSLNMDKDAVKDYVFDRVGYTETE